MPFASERFSQVAENGSLENVPHLGWLLYAWKSVADESAPRSWLEKCFQDQETTLKILKACISVGSSTSEKGVFYRYAIEQKTAEIFFGDLKKIDAITKDLSFADLPRDEMRALRAFRDLLSPSISNRRRRGSGEDPLEEPS